MKRLLIACAVLTLAIAPSLALAAIDDTVLVNRSDGAAGAAANGDTGLHPAVSGDGRFVAFVSAADNLSSADNDSVQNLFLRDTQSQTTTLVSRATGPDGVGADADSSTPAVSSDGRFVAFATTATNLIEGVVELTQDRDIFVRDMQLYTTVLVSRAAGPAGEAGALDSLAPTISDSGTQIAFHSAADNLSTEDTDGTSDVFVRDTAAGTTTLVSRAHGTGGAAGNGNSYRPSISASGQRVAFESDADNLADDDNDAVTNIFVRESRFRSTYHVSRTTSTGSVSLGADGDSSGAALSDDGSVVAFTSLARNLSDVNTVSTGSQVFKRNIAGERTTLVSRAGGVDGAPADGGSFRANVSSDGRYVAFISRADNLSDQDGAGTDVFVRDTVDERTALASRATGSGGPGADGSSYSPAISSSGLLVAFLSDADNLSLEDDNALVNLFTRELAPGLPAPNTGPDLGNNDHGQHGGAAHSGANHSAAGHSPAHSGGSGHGHAPSNVRLRGGILFASKRQDIDNLFVFVTIHEPGRIVLEGQVRLPGASRAHRFKPVRRKLQPHILRKMRLKLSTRSLRTVKRALRGKRLNARVKLTAVSDSGKRQIVRRTIRLRP